jgi:hypothetical protein
VEKEILINSYTIYTASDSMTARDILSLSGKISHEAVLDKARADKKHYSSYNRAMEFKV